MSQPLSGGDIISHLLFSSVVKSSFQDYVFCIQKQPIRTLYTIYKFNRRVFPQQILIEGDFRIIDREKIRLEVWGPSKAPNSSSF